MDSMTMTESARPMAVDGDRTGVLLIHGFTGSPASVRPWGEHFAALGHTVRIPRLPGHGTTWQEMNRTRWQDWYAEVDAALTEITARVDTVLVCGLSMGGCLALRLAEQRPADVDALVLVNPAVHVADKRLLAVPVVRHFIGAVKGIGNDIKKVGADECGYGCTPLHALHSQMQMWKDVRAAMSHVTTPLLLIRSVVDHVVDPSSSQIIMDGVSSTTRREILLADSYHVATLDNDADLLFAESAAFFAERLGAPDGR